MKQIKAPYDRYLMMIGLSLVLGMVNPEGPFWGAFGISLAFTFTYWEGNYRIVGYIREKYPQITQTTRRILIQGSLSLIYTVSVGTVLVLLLHLFSLIPYHFSYHLQVVVIGLFITVIISIVYETVFYFHLWKTSLLEGEIMKKTEARLQFESLKNQVNPHFLFNSLNTLSSLIHSDPDKAEQFVQEFAGIYRYVLEVKDKTFVSLDEELGFVQSYVFLQQIRFGDQLKFENKISGSKGDLYIPPLILQNLIENCIKHNVINEKNPLKIMLYIEGERLIVKNNLQERSGNVGATRTGLNNIQQRLRLVSDLEARFYKTDGYFYAEVPIVTPE